jgi:endogenous inhibitor of DNA gyrase (YacG/DUF329 family)
MKAAIEKILWDDPPSCPFCGAPMTWADMTESFRDPDNHAMVVRARCPACRQGRRWRRIPFELISQFRPDAILTAQPTAPQRAQTEPEVRP